MSVLDEEHLQMLRLCHEVKLGVRDNISLGHRNGGLLRLRVLVLFGEQRLGQQRTGGLFVCRNGERCTHCAGQGVAAVIDGHNGQTAGVGQGIVGAHDGSGDRPHLDEHLALFGLLVHYLPGEVIVLGVNREVHVHVGFQHLVHLVQGNRGEGCILRNDLGGAQREDDPFDAAELGRGQGGLQDLAHRVRIVDDAVLNGPFGQVGGKAGQDGGHGSAQLGLDDTDLTAGELDDQSCAG